MDSMLPFSAEHESFRAYVRAFAAAELQPRSRQWDEGAELPREAIRLLGSAGLLNILGPKSLGGQARDDVRADEARPARHHDHSPRHQWSFIRSIVRVVEWPSSKVASRASPPQLSTRSPPTTPSRV